MIWNSQRREGFSISLDKQQGVGTRTNFPPRLGPHKGCQVSVLFSSFSVIFFVFPKPALFSETGIHTK